MRFRRRKQFETDMDAELRFHIEAYAADLVRGGISPQEAERRARVEFGSMDGSKEECRQSWGYRFLDELRADLRLAFRTIRRSPGFAAVSVLSLAIGIGANAAIFGLLDAVAFRLLPVRDPGRLVFVETAGISGRDGPPYPFFELVREKATSFESISAFSTSRMELTIDRGRELARGVWISGNFHETLGVQPVIGRLLTEADRAAAVISRSYWVQRFGADPEVIGRNIYVQDHAVTIVGVMPTEVMSMEPGFPVDVAAPIVLSDPARTRERGALWLFVVGRLKPGVRVEQARAEVDALFRPYAADLPLTPEVRRRLFDHMELSPAERGLRGLRYEFSKPLIALMTLAGLVVIAACVNMSNLMLARAMARRKDFAVRLAIGAGRGRLIRQNITEALVLVASAAALGIVLARFGEAGIAAFFAHRLTLDLSLNSRVLLFTLIVGTLSALATGIVPAVRATSLDPAGGLHAGSRSVAGSRISNRLSRALVVAQVALSMVLLSGAALFVQSLRGLETVGLGFDREGILTMEVAPDVQLRRSPEWSGMQAETLDRIRQIQGVRSAGWSTTTPMSGWGRGAMIEAEGFTPRSDSDKDIHLSVVSPGFLETLGAPLLLGRGFTAADRSGAPKVALVNESAARFYFHDANPLGRKLRFVNYPRGDLSYEIVGVVRDIIHDNPRDLAARFVYLPIGQPVERINRLGLAVRSTGAPAALAEPIRRLIQGERTGLMITGVSTMEKQIAQTLVRERLVATLATAFGAVALALAAIGLYGILAYAVTQRTNEIGIRMALGASRTEVVWMVLREALALAGGGILMGVPAVVAIAKVAKASLYGVGPFDPRAFAIGALLLLIFAVMAAILPTRRASSLDPTMALRQD
jgi:predicted permease